MMNIKRIVAILADSMVLLGGLLAIYAFLDYFVI